MESLRPALQAAGIFIYPLLAVGLIGVACSIDRIYVFQRYARLPPGISGQISNLDFAWEGLRDLLSKADPRSSYVRFLNIIAENASRPAWWIESRAADEAVLIERRLGQGLWVLETVVTAAPLLGLLGTISGMIGAFRVFGGTGAVDPRAVTGGVAEALVATAIGIVSALLSLFAYNYFSHRQAQVMDEMERLGTRLIDRIRIDREGNA
jgi:biopolymer transport protein ExbB